MNQQFPGSSPQQMQQQQAQAVWAATDPLVLCKTVRQKAYQHKEISKNPELIAPLEELISRFEQTLRATGVTTSPQYAAGAVSQGQQSF